jgi:hypothetical protein
MENWLEALDNETKRRAIKLLEMKKMLDAGIQPDEIGRLARYIAGDAIHQALYRLDDPYDFDLKNGGDNYPGWCLN